jgi:mannose-1-phosphate guanylyltransferase
MNNEKVEYWTGVAFTKMRKEKTIMPTTIERVLELDEFKSSGITEEELRQSIKESFLSKRQVIKNIIIEKLNKSKENNNE